MAAARLFGDVKGDWYKGNLHGHSTESDGKMTPPEVVDWYRGRGYDFIALTDHRKVTPVDTLQGNGDGRFLCLPGVELNTRDRREGRQGLFHIVGIGVRPDCDCTVVDEPQALIDAIRNAGGLPFIAHPKWSGNFIDGEFLALDGYIGIECFNYGCEVENHTGVGDIHWDMLSLSGRRVFGLATDDSHSLVLDGGGGWVMVKAESLSTEAILDSIKKGHFYSSSGPEIYDVALEDGTLSVRCSKAAAVHFMTGGPLGLTVRAAEGATGADGAALLEQAQYKLRGRERFVRIEVVDAQGRVAWTNPIFFD